jgi:hypothetical protein
LGERGNARVCRGDTSSVKKARPESRRGGQKESSVTRGE